jgi:hypothetical protein
MYTTLARDDSKNDKTIKGSRTVDEVWQTLDRQFAVLIRKALGITGRIQRFTGIESREQEHLRNYYWVLRDISRSRCVLHFRLFVDPSTQIRVTTEVLPPEEKRAWEGSAVVSPSLKGAQVSFTEGRLR